MIAIFIVLIGMTLNVAAWAAPEGIGTLADVQGTIEINGAVARVGAELRLGMRVVTQPGSRAVLKFADGQTVTLDPSSVFWIKDYRYARNQPTANRSSTELLKGGMRFISGAMAKETPEAVKIETPVATIGIRGTDFTVVLGSLCLLVREGAVIVSAAGKSTIGQAGQIVFVQDANTPPRFLPASELPLRCAPLLETTTPGIGMSPATASAVAAATAALIGATLMITDDDPNASP